MCDVLLGDIRLIYRELAKCTVKKEDGLEVKKANLERKVEVKLNLNIKYDLLAKYLANLPKDVQDSENVLRAKAAAAFRNGNYGQLYSILESYHFSPR